ncbi:MAG TPA: hydroxysqualene dehydroxylase HpnE [Methyloversatilis sp.]
MNSTQAPGAARTGPTVAIVGGGWAGLSCAVECVQRGLRPTVFEAAASVGGRARTVGMDGLRLDNGQHILIGAYDATLAMMRAVGADPDLLLRRQPLALSFADGFELRARSGSRLGLAMAFLGCRGLGWRDRLAALRLMRAIERPCGKDETVAGLLARTAQTANNTRHLWAPLCIAALNTGIVDASAHVFACVLRDSLMGARGASDLLLPRVDLGQLFPEPAVDWLTAHDCAVRTGVRIRAVREDEGGFALSDGTAGEIFDRVVFAASPHQVPALLGELPGLTALAAQIGLLEYEPISTVYAAFDAGMRLPAAMTGFAEGEPHWLFDRGALGGPAGLTASVISAATMPREQTEAAVLATLRAHHPDLPAPLWVRTITEKRATFRCTPARVPVAQPADARIALAGDYLLPDYPATLESAVRSGVAAARRISAPSP